MPPLGNVIPRPRCAGAPNPLVVDVVLLPLIGLPPRVLENPVALPIPLGPALVLARPLATPPGGNIARGCRGSVQCHSICRHSIAAANRRSIHQGLVQSDRDVVVDKIMSVQEFITRKVSRNA